MRSGRPGSASAADGNPRFREPNMVDPPPGRAYISVAAEATLLCSSEMAVEAVIFDMDGVLVDSEPFGFEALRRVMARYGLGYSEEENAEFLGRTTLESCRILKARHALPDAAETLADLYIEGMLAQIGDGPVPMPGVPEVLERVRAAGYRMALASSAEVRVIHANLTALALGPLFEAVVSGTEVARGKPAPDVFLAAADRLAVAPDRCLVIEDSRNGLLAARAAGMRCAVVPCAHTRHQDFREADHHLTRLPDLLALL
jgi:HAD superfamily hydrolase (TIGR01509 family)